MPDPDPFMLESLMTSIGLAIGTIGVAMDLAMRVLGRSGERLGGVVSVLAAIGFGTVIFSEVVQDKAPWSLVPFAVILVVVFGVAFVALSGWLSANEDRRESGKRNAAS